MKIGIDIVYVLRPLHKDFFHESELVKNDNYNEHSLAGKYAAKEAFVKALGTGFVDGLLPKDIWVVKLPSGAPTLAFSSKAQTLLAANNLKFESVSISHDRDYATAVVLLTNVS